MRMSGVCGSPAHLLRENTVRRATEVTERDPNRSRCGRKGYAWRSWRKYQSPRNHRLTSPRPPIDTPLLADFGCSRVPLRGMKPEKGEEEAQIGRAACREREEIALGGV